MHLLVADSRKVDPPSSRIELLFIDGDHSYEGARADFERWSAFVRPGGHVLFHDAVDSGGYGNVYPGVARVVAEVEREPGGSGSRTRARSRTSSGGREPLSPSSSTGTAATDTLAALRSLDGVETICVDNGSTDGSDAAVAEQFPAVELIRTGANLGFAGGNNVGIRRALERGADWVLLLNNDATAEPGLAGRARATRRRRGPTRACSRARSSSRTAARCSTPARRSTRGSATRGASPTTGDDRHARRRPCRRRRARRLARRSRAARACSTRRCSCTSRTSSGRCASGEPGFAVVLVPDARVRHKGSAASGGRASTTNLYYDTRNTIVVAERHAPLPRGARALRRGVVVGAHLVQAHGTPRAPRPCARSSPAGATPAPAGSVREARA